MRDLEQLVSEWRGEMTRAGIATPVPLDELEGHLREDIEWRMKAGLSAEQAFEIAVQQIGEAHVLKTEFKKNGKMIPKEEPMLALAFAAATCFLSVFGGFFVIYWSIVDLQTPPDEQYRAGAMLCLLLGLLIVIAAGRAAFICLTKMKLRRARFAK